MKLYILALSLLIQVACAATALAVPVTLDFSSVTATTDITVPNNATIGDVTMSYEPFGSVSDFAIVDSAGIFGTTAGMLALDFSRPTTALSLNFMLFDAFSAAGDGFPMSDAFAAIFSREGNILDAAVLAADFSAYDPATDPTLGFAFGALDYSGPAFDRAEMYFSFEAPFFSVDNVVYEPVPEPATFVLLAAGLLGLGGWRLVRNRA